MTAFLAIVARDIRLAIGRGGGIGTALGFYLIVVSLIPLGLGPDINLLARIAPGVLWVALLLSALLSADGIFAADEADGSLDILSMSALPLEAVTFAKMAAHWLSTALPLVLLTPLLGLLLNLEGAAYPTLLLSMLVGSPAVSAIGAVGAALTLRARKGGQLVALLVLPLYVPTLIFGVTSVEAAQTSPAGAAAPLLILAAISLASSALAPFAAAAALRARS
ncbi:MAG TPA: heme exporter protein CcmB [Hyphomicrobiaceae bacterium]|nr:heme exporter protein CcmB [Hyphomicrobiaceae bacterium]